MKRCPKCQETKTKSEFGSHSTRRDGVQVYCRLCRKEVDRASYKKDPSKQVQRNRDRVNKNKLKAFEYLSKHPCIDCGMINPIVLTFDHVRGQKRGDVARMINSSISWESILVEIGKCEVRCFNCHMIKTSKERGWHKVAFTRMTDLERAL